MKRHARKDAGLRPVKSIPIEAPPFQNWSCRGCANCCRDTLRVELSAEEQQRLAAQGWSHAEGVDPASMIVTEGGRARLGHRSDGACVFLDAASRCRIHAKFGEPAKPLACRSFPFALHPAGRKLVASLRFSCPAAAENLGPPLAAKTADLRELAEAVFPAGCDRRPPPSVWREPGLDWEDFLRYVGWLDRTLADEDVPSALKVCRALSWLQAVAKASFDGLTGSAADEILAALVGSAAQKFSAPSVDGARPSGLGAFLLRQLAIECAWRAGVTRQAADQRLSLATAMAAGAHRRSRRASALAGWRLEECPVRRDRKTPRPAPGRGGGDVDPVPAGQSPGIALLRSGLLRRFTHRGISELGPSLRGNCVAGPLAGGGCGPCESVGAGCRQEYGDGRPSPRSCPATVYAPRPIADTSVDPAGRSDEALPLVRPVSGAPPAFSLVDSPISVTLWAQQFEVSYAIILSLRWPLPQCKDGMPLDGLTPPMKVGQVRSRTLV